MALTLAFFLYFLILALIAWLSHKKMKDSTAFIVGNRSINFYLTALSAHASDMSAWLFMAFPAALYVGGMPQIWTAFGLFMGMFLNWQLVARRLRLATEALQTNTLASYFEKSFGDETGVLRLVAAVAILVFMSCYLCAGLMAMGLLIESLFGFPYLVGTTLSAVAVMGYTFYGGFITVAWTDLFQALFLLAMLILVPFYALSQMAGGWASVIEAAAAQQISLDPMPAEGSLLQLALLAMSWGLGYFGQPHIITKFMGIDHPQDMIKAKRLGMSWQAVALFMAALVGIVAIGFFEQPLANPELVYIELVKQLFSPFFGGIVLCAILAANISTMDSQLLVSASLLSEDLYGKLINAKASPKKLLLVSRLCILIVMSFSLLIAMGRSSNVMSTVFYAWTGLGCAFGPVVLFSLYDQKANYQGALMGMVVGSLTAALWDLLYPLPGLFPLPAMVPAFGLSSLAIYTTSRLTGGRRLPAGEVS